MKLSAWAKRMGITYKTAWRWFREGKIEGAFKTPSGSIFVPDEVKKEDYVVIYARVSSSENKAELDAQAERLRQYALAKGYRIREVIKEIGSGLNDNRRRLQKLLRDGKATKILVEHKDRLTRFGFNYLKTLLANQGCEIEVVDESKEDKKELMDDLIRIITSFCARYYGLRRSKRKIEKIIEELKRDDQAGDPITE